MARRDVVDDYGQVDGDAGAPSQFAYHASQMTAQPWLRGGSPPWHLWGNSQQVTTLVELPAGVTGRPQNPGVGQLVKVSYKRPTAWNWVLSSRLISGPGNGSLASNVIVTVDFELIVGVGRSFISMAPQLIFASSQNFSPPFERHRFTYGSNACPVNAQIWSTKTTSPSRTFAVDTVGPAPILDAPTEIDTIIAQDIQLIARVFATAEAPNTAIGQPIVVEVSAQFSPVVHVRPDWFINKGPPELRFSGDETGGR